MNKHTETKSCSTCRYQNRAWCDLKAQQLDDIRRPTNCPRHKEKNR